MTRQRQQQGFIVVQSQKPQKFQKVLQVDAWEQRQQQVQTIQKQFRKIDPEQQDVPTIYVDKKTNKICLFHGTTTDQFHFFTEKQKTILPRFYLSFDLKEAIWYATHRHQQKKKQQAGHIYPGLLVFKLKDESILKTLEYSDTHIVLKKQKDIRLFLKNTTVEMITIKPSSTKKKEQSK